MIKLDHRQLEPETLNNVLTDIVLREGTDYGLTEISVDDKKEQLRQALNTGKAIIIYYAKEGFCDVVSNNSQ